MTGDGCSTRNMSLAWFLLTFEKRLTRGPTAIQSLGLAGDLWCWIRDSLSGRTHVTTINGCQSQPMPVAIGGTDPCGRTTRICASPPPFFPLK